MKISGSCFCGAVKYQAEIDASRVGICHCRDCQIFSGSAFRTACRCEPGKFRFTHGAPNIFEKTADSGRVRRIAFCGVCGTHLCSMSGAAVEDGGYVSVRVATAEQFHEITPAAEYFCASRVPWLPPNEAFEQFAGMPQPAPAGVK